MNQQPEIVLGLRMALIGRQAEPLERLSIITRNRLALPIEQAEVVLGLGVALSGREAKPFQGRHCSREECLRHRHTSRRGCVALQGEPVPLESLLVILWNAQALLVELAKVEL